MFLSWRKRYCLAWATGAGLAALFAGGMLPAFLTGCLFKKVTGLPCPSCGTGRALLLILQEGRWADALILNPFAWLVLAFSAVGFAWSLRDLWRGEPSFWRALRTDVPWVAKLGILLLAAANLAWNVAKGV